MNAGHGAATMDLDLLACPLDGLRLIEASAGTGKTWNICGLYLRLLLEKGVEAPGILVVTFTNAATAELRTRIRRRIVDVLGYLQRGASQAGPAADPFVDRLVAAAEERSGVDRRDLRLRLEAALQTFDEAAVYTIHGFCQRALSDTPFAAGLPFQLELLPDDSALRLEAVNDFWRRHVASGAIAPALADALLRQRDRPETWARLLGRRIARPRARLIWPDDTPEANEAIDPSPLVDAFATARRLWGDAGAAASDALLAGLAALNANSYRAESVHAGAREWTDTFRRGDALALPDPETSKARLFTARFIAQRTKARQTPPRHPFFAAADDLLARHATLTNALRLARLHLLRRMLDECGGALREEKRRQRVQSFDDMLHGLDAALTSGDYPWLADSLRRRYPVALIDEFQDTDPLQYAIFQRIYGATGERPAAPLFLVGDPKQAIYSFRNADLHTYLAARHAAGTPYTLRHNQRSTAELIAACNALFAANPAAFILAGLNYTPVTAGDRPRPRLAEQGETTSAAMRVWRLPTPDGGYLPRAEATRLASQATAGEVARLLAAATGGLVTLGERALAPADIAILVRSHAQGQRIREALRRVGVGSVELSQNSIFQTPDAEELERILLAIAEAGRPALLYGALSTELMGFDASALAALAADERRLMESMARFGAYRETWLRRGFGVMLRAWIDGEAVARRLLARRDGERRLTNLLHLGELLQQADAEHRAPESLLRWLAGRRREAVADEDSQLRLESDRNLVQVVTIHKAKGLEYAVVFCPFLWDGQPSNFGQDEGRDYHDDDGRPVIDFRPDTDTATVNDIARRRRAEKDAEFMRLLYVALTRAAQRCYLVAGCYSTLAFGRTSTAQSRRSLLNWLVAGKGLSHAEWLTHQRPEEEIEQAWRALAEAAGPALSLRDLPVDSPPPLAGTDRSPASLAALPAPARIAAGWRIGSFSSLQHGADSEAAASDHDARVLAGRASAETVPAADLAPDDILLFPRGAAAGDCVHALFERVDFSHPAHWPAIIDQVLASHPPSPARPDADAARRAASMLHRLLDDVLNTRLPGDVVLATLRPRQRLVELAFHLPAAGLTAARLNGWLAAHGYPLPRLACAALDGYLKGFIDLVFEHAGRYHILDWKSNHLGFSAGDYGQRRLASAMAEHGYHLQHLIYSVALQRYLRRRIADYDYERHFGGVYYLFVRGVRPAWYEATAGGQRLACGVYSHRPSKATLDAFDALLAPPSPGVAA
ncbi:exodeoxyribonuclease V subunit beta [Accumulibacter sp.]|uniref:exodeoxyribonuclease V subunit beta n=1 Tax=Accumulibacter sp. TaxID=2053492 RepID=UPI002612D142|nr:exodeoxyribonuclease V subunit beta [Accumulibacter sp.]